MAFRPEDTLESYVTEPLEKLHHKLPPEDEDLKALSEAIENLVMDRRKLGLGRVEPLQDFVEGFRQVADEVEQAAEEMIDEANRVGVKVSKKTRTFIGDVKSAFDRLRKDA